MRRREFLLSTGVGAGLASAWRPSASAAGSTLTQTDNQNDQITAFVTAKMAEYRVPGVALGIVKGNRISMRGFGVTNVDDPQPVTVDTIFTIASISKTFTATAIMRLVEQGKLDLRAPVQKYLPDFRVQSEAVSREVSIWHLLTHTPGWEGQLSSEDRGVDALAHFASTILRDVPQLADPGAVWSYNNAGFSLAGRVIEVVTGRNIHDAIRELVIAPLEMARTFTRLADAAAYRMTLGHREQGGVTRVIRPIQTTSGVTAGGVMTSVGDLLRYARVHLRGGVREDGQQWMTKPLFEQMRTPQVPKPGTDDEMGAGWHLRKLNGVQTAAHGGTLNGHCLLVELVPARELAFVILTNHSDGWRLVQDLEQRILKDYESIALSPGQRIGHRGVNEAMSFHSQPLATQPKLDEYVGTYRRPPVGSVIVRLENDGLVIGQGNNAQGGTRLTFYGKDVAYAVGNGNAYEFIRKPDGAIGWIRVVGRIARKE